MRIVFVRFIYGGRYAHLIFRDVMSGVEHRHDSVDISLLFPKFADQLEQCWEDETAFGNVFWGQPGNIGRSFKIVPFCAPLEKYDCMIN